MGYSTLEEIPTKESSDQIKEKTKKNGFFLLQTCLYRVFCHHPTDGDQDKGLAWLVLFWSTIALSLTTGLFYGSYGPINIILQKKFNISVNTSSFIVSLNSCLLLFTTPITSILTKKLSCRKMQITGGCMVVIGFGGCAFTDEIWPIYPLYGILAGFGASCCYVSVPGVLVHHFQDLKYVAFAITMFGNRASGAAWASLSQLMFSSLGFSLTMGALGLVEILSIIAGFFMTERKSVERGKETELLLSSKSSSDSRIDSIDKKSLDKEVVPNPQKQDNTTSTAKSENFNTEDFDVKKELKMLFTDWHVWCLILNFGFWSINSHGFYFFINDYVVKYSGISETDAALGVSIMGFGSLAASMLNIAISKMDFDRVIFYTPMSTIYGLATILMVFTNGKTMFYCLTTAFGLSYGLTTGNLYAVCYSFHGPRLMNVIFSLGMCAQGLSGLITGPICSYLQTHVHHTAGIAFAGATGIAASLTLVPVIINRWLKPKPILRE